MSSKTRFLFLLTFLIFMSFSTSWAQAPDSSMSKIFSMDLEDLMNTKVNIATKSDQKITETPSVVSVITSNDIKRTGARELEDLLQFVPGFELIRRLGGEYGVDIRGVKDSRNTSKLLIMIDGVPYNQIFYGNSIAQGYDINIDAIDRIEIIRGPGSALYGRNAFSGVINIITKNALIDEGLTAKGSVGTFNTKSFSAYYGIKKKKFNSSIAVRKLNTDITDEKFEDGFGSIAKWNLFRDNLSLNTNVGYGKFSFSGMFLSLKGGGFLNQTEVLSKTGYYSVSYKDNLSPKLNITSKIFGNYGSYIEDIEILKPGLDTTYPNGIYYKPRVKQYLVGFETELGYKVSTKNNLLIGIQIDFHGVKDVLISANVDSLSKEYPDPIDNADRNNQVLYKPGWFDKNRHDYHNLALFVQDIWQPTQNLGITIGGRYDIDSQIGATFNPRVGFVLDPFKNANLKLLYGRAYRAPSPSEQFQTLGFAFGNKNLKPEIINTLEFVLSYRFDRVSSSISLFRNDLKNMIYALPINSVDSSNRYYNIGKNTSTGIEVENKIFINSHIYSFINYSYTVSENTDTINGKVVNYTHQDVAPHKISFGVNYSFKKYFNINLNMFYRSTMKKFILRDSKGNYLTDAITGNYVMVNDPIGNFAVFNSTFYIDNLIKNLSLSLSAYNIFNQKYYSQDTEHLNQPPQPGRQFILHLSYSIN